MEDAQVFPGAMKRHPKKQGERSWVEICCFGCTCLQLFWPGIVLKKWLNINAKESDFSADEPESESEFEDEEPCELDREAHNDIKKGAEFICQSTVTPSENFMARIRRRKSETLRVQYINTKEIRICVSTWNVGGRLPPDDLDISGWLDMEEPADLYVIGLQEIVPLNAGNVFGAEDSRPVPKWEHLIRETLNRIQPIKKKYKCYSNPTSPSKFKPSDDVPIIEDEIFHESYAGSDDEVDALNKSSFNYNMDEVCRNESRLAGNQLCKGDDGRSILEEMDSPKQSSQTKKKLDRLHHFSWIEREANSEASEDQPKSKLAKTYSFSERIGLSWPEQPLDLLAQHVLDKQNSFKTLKSLKSANSFKPSTVGDYRGLSEAAFITGADLEYNTCRKKQSAFVRIVSKQMVGIFLSIWVRRSFRRHIHNLKVSTVGVGVMGYIGNKGSVSVSMSIYQTHFCFVCSHLTSGEKDGDQLRRNADVQEIQRRTHFNSVPGIGSPKRIHDHERIIWFGDLNYRINLPYEKTRELISKKELSKLFEFDQLIREFRKGRAFDGWSEGTLHFPPTYKYEFNSEKYVGEDPKAGRRTPAWCDRILSFGKGIRQLSYKRINQRLSDHRPVTAVFMAEVEVFCHRKLQRALTFTDAELEESNILPNIEMEIEASEISRLKVWRGSVRVEPLGTIHERSDKREL